MVICETGPKIRGNERNQWLEMNNHNPGASCGELQNVSSDKWQRRYCSIAAMPNSLQPHELEQARLLCPLLSPRVCSNSCPLSWWYYLTIWSSVILLSFCLQCFPVSLRIFSNESALHIKWSASVELQLQWQSFQWKFRVDFL